MKTTYLISFLVVFMCMQQFVFGQSPGGSLGNGNSNTSTELGEAFPCKYSGISSTNPFNVNEFYLLGATSPASDALTVSNPPTSSTDELFVQANSTVTFLIKVLDLDLSCTSDNDILGAGPYRIEFLISNPNGATFLANGQTTYVVDNIMNEGNSGQIDVQIPTSWDGNNNNNINVTAILSDMEELGDDCAAFCGSQDDPSTFSWDLKKSPSGCPNNLEITSLTYTNENGEIVAVQPNNFSTNYPLPVNLQLQALPSQSYNTYISEEVSFIFPNFDYKRHIDQSWLDAHPDIMSSQQVLDMFVMPTNFVGGGFALNGFGFIDTYNITVGENFIPFSAGALNLGTVGFQFTHDYFCSSSTSTLDKHTAKFFFKSNQNTGNVDVKVRVRNL